MKEELENLSESDARIRQMLGDDLRRVEAPKDFEFHLKARIANANPKSYSRIAGYRKRFAYALPVTAVAIISTFAVINGNFFGGSATNQTPLSMSSVTSGGGIGIQISTPQPTVATTVAFTAPPQNLPSEATTASRGESKENVVTNSNNESSESSTELQPSFAIIKSTSSQKSKTQPTRRFVRENEGFSRDQAVTPPKVFTPRNLDPEKKIEIPNDFKEGKDISVEESFSTLGVETSSENGVLKVKSVRPNSQAEKLGIKADDRIETVNGQKISVSPVRGKKIELKKIGVRRGTEQVEINLQGNPK